MLYFFLQSLEIIILPAWKSPNKCSSLLLMSTVDILTCISHEQLMIWAFISSRCVQCNPLWIYLVCSVLEEYKKMRFFYILYDCFPSSKYIFTSISLQARNIKFLYPEDSLHTFKNMKP